MGDMPQLGTELGLYHPERAGKCETVAANGAERPTTRNNSDESELGVDVAEGSATGIIPRAVDDIFRIVRQGGVGEEEPPTPTRSSVSSCSQYSFGEPPEAPQQPRAETVRSPGTACRSRCASAQDMRTPGTSHSTSSSGSTSSQDSAATQIPSAAHWPLGEQIVYVPRPKAQGGGPYSPMKQRVQPCDDTVNAEEGGGSIEKPRACEKKHGETISARRHCVQCSYVQVRFYEQSSKREADEGARAHVKGSGCGMKNRAIDPTITQNYSISPVQGGKSIQGPSALTKE